MTVTYRPHGHVPNDFELAHLSYKAFGPLRAPFVPTAEQFQAAARDMATGDPDELADLAAEVAGYWRDDDDEYWALWCV